MVMNAAVWGCPSSLVGAMGAGQNMTLGQKLPPLASLRKERYPSERTTDVRSRLRQNGTRGYCY